jgi:NAD(P)-dependent dehydrogenase (short-subunit alcohol dehydrogenase family)
MSPADASAPVLRPGVLDGARMIVTGPVDADAEPGTTVATVCTHAGARVVRCRPPGGSDVEAQEAATDAAVAAALTELGGGTDVLVVDAAALLAAEGGSLGACLQTTWDAARAVAQRALIGSAGGRIVLLAPAPGGGDHAAAALAALENLARTLSIEWARHAITCVAISPGERTRHAQLAQLVVYLASPAGAYFSGCLLDLRGQVE